MIDNLPPRFTYDKEITLENGEIIKSTISCIVKGVRRQNVDDGTRTVIFEKCGWKLTHEQVSKWASFYGNVLTKVTESQDDDLDPDVRPEDNNVGCGNLQVTVKINKAIPQFLPMYGHKIRVYYKDIPRVCTNCYEAGHVRKSCTNTNKIWVHHVTEFISENERIPEECFGFWLQKSREYVSVNPHLFDVPDAPDDPSSDLDDMNLSSAGSVEEDEGTSDVTVTSNEPKQSVSNIIEALETNSKMSKQTKKSIEPVTIVNEPEKPSSKVQPTVDKKKTRGRPPKDK